MNLNTYHLNILYPTPPPFFLSLSNLYIFLFKTVAGLVKQLQAYPLCALHCILDQELGVILALTTVTEWLNLGRIRLTVTHVLLER